jgi:hypothetical protein
VNAGSIPNSAPYVIAMTKFVGLTGGVLGKAAAEGSQEGYPFVVAGFVGA